MLYIGNIFMKCDGEGVFHSGIKRIIESNNLRYTVK